MFFSVVISLYNKSKSVARTIESVLSQTHTDFELVIVNDGSTDDSLKVVSGIRDDRIRIISTENRGVSAARNTGVSAASSNLVAFLDADDYWEPSFLMTQAALIDAFPEAALYGCNYADVSNGQIKAYNQGMGDSFCGYVEDYFGTSHGDLYCSSSVIVRKRAIESVGGFDERIRYAEDMDLWYRLILRYPVVYSNQVLAYYNKDAENRAEKNIYAHFDIEARMDNYIEKFSSDLMSNRAFSRFFCVRIAWNLLYGNYYFGNKRDRKACDRIVKHFQYKNMPYKYRLIFKTPRIFGYAVFKASVWKKKLFA